MHMVVVVVKEEEEGVVRREGGEEGKGTFLYSPCFSGGGAYNVSAAN